MFPDRDTTLDTVSPWFPPPAPPSPSRVPSPPPMPLASTVSHLQAKILAGKPV